MAPDHPPQTAVVLEGHCAVAHQQHGCRKAVARQVDSVVIAPALIGCFGCLSDDHQPFGALIASVGVDIHAADQCVVPKSDGRCLNIGDVASSPWAEQVENHRS